MAARARRVSASLDRRPVDRMILATWGGGLRVVLAVYGRPDDAPQTDAQRDDYCTFVASLLRATRA